METRRTIFEYESARRFLLDQVEQKQRADATFSIRRWAREMGVSHSLIVMLLQGKRPITVRLASVLANGLGLSTPERLFIQALVQLENAVSEEERQLCRLWLAEINPGAGFRVREVDEYLVIAHWVHMAILALTDVASFSGRAEEVFLRLGGKVPIHEIRAAVERLRALKLIEERGGRWICTAGRVTTRDDVASKGAREYHKQVARLGADLIDQQPVDIREFQSFAVAVPSSRIPLAKEMIRKFRTQFYEAMTQEPGEHVYQASIQFFRLTESPSELVPKEDEGAGAHYSQQENRS